MVLQSGLNGGSGSLSAGFAVRLEAVSNGSGETACFCAIMVWVAT